MKVLIIKMSSMGDIVHTFPALTDAGKFVKNIRFDWVVENTFKELPKWHPLVENVIPVALRKWRKQPFTTLRSGELLKALKQIRKTKYDFIIDAQGLLKSMIISCFAKGTRCGFDKTSSRESWATFVYQRKTNVAKNQHAVNRIRELFAKSLNYNLPTSVPDYGLIIPKPVGSQQLIFDHVSNQSPQPDLQILTQCVKEACNKVENLTTKIIKEDYFVFLPNTTWATKHWPEVFWRKLIDMVTIENYQVKIPWGTSLEEERAKRLAKDNKLVTVLPHMPLTEIASIIANAKAIVALDTGLAHIAAAYNIPSISLYGPSNPVLSGALGLNQTLLAAKFECAPCLKRQCQFSGDKTIDPPCFSSIPPEFVWHELKKIL